MIAAEIDRVIARKVRVDALIELTVAGTVHVKRLVAAVIFWKLLLDDIRLDGHAEMIGLAREVGRNVIVLVLLEGAVTQIAPENRGHAEFMGVSEGLADFDDLASAVVGAKINRRAGGRRAPIVTLLHGSEKHLIATIGKRPQLIGMN